MEGEESIPQVNVVLSVAETRWDKTNCSNGELFPLMVEQRAAVYGQQRTVAEFEV